MTQTANTVMITRTPIPTNTVMTTVTTTTTGTSVAGRRAAARKVHYVLVAGAPCLDWPGPRELVSFSTPGTVRVLLVLGVSVRCSALFSAHDRTKPDTGFQTFQPAGGVHMYVCRGNSATHKRSVRFVVW